MFENLLNDLKDAKCVLVGLGEAFTLKKAEDELKYIQFYKQLKEVLGNKDYYIVTQAEDDLIFRCGFDKKHVAAPFVYPEDEENWNAYLQWLGFTLNRHLLVLELGVGFANPMVIRFPFEKTVFLNQKSRMYRVHPSLPQVTAEIGERGSAVQADPLDLFSDH
ncbi:MAG: hypothetical protein ACI4DV_06045 [Lachnospiraceae bacterium]